MLYNISVNKTCIHKEYIKSCGTFQLVLPIATEILIPADDSVRLLSQQLEELDYSKLYQAYSHMGRNPVVSPKNLFKVLVYGYMSDVISSRGIEQACRRDINYMYLLEGQRAPDHNTISRFRSGRLREALADLFRQVVSNLHLFGEIPFENLFVDGTKIEASANKYSFVWKKSTLKNEARLFAKLRALQRDDEKPLQNRQEALVWLESKLEALELRCLQENIVFVYGSGKHKTSTQRDLEKLNEFKEQLRKYDHYQSLFDGRNSFSKTDTDATFMHMKEDHMRNSQLKPAYNVQIAVESEYIVGVDISSERSDCRTLIPMLEKLASQFHKRHHNIVADAGYESEENYQYLKDNGLETYIKPQNYERMKSRANRKKIGYAENMQYERETDTFICTQGRKLKPIFNRTRKNTGGFKSDLTVYECETCVDCSVSGDCKKSAGNKRMELSRTFLDQRKESFEHITSEKGTLLRMNRSIQVEGVFGAIKEDHGFRRFLLRGRKNVEVEFLLMSLGHNINKLHKRIQNGRCGQHLHLIKCA